MKTIVFQGGIGNQIFQYALYLYLQKEKGYRCNYIFVGNAHNGMEITKYFNVDLQEANSLWYKLYYVLDKLSHRGFKPLTSYEGERAPFKKKYIEGYWQDKQYFSTTFIRFKELALSEQNEMILKLIQNENSVCIHIRRGDYLLPYYYNIYGNVCTEFYYQKAIEIAKQHINAPSFFIFSDDIDWVKKNLVINDATYIDWNTGQNSIFDMYLMSNSKVNIIANSSFSFWGAFLNTRSPIVIYPKKWFNSTYQVPDIFPSSWIGVSETHII